MRVELKRDAVGSSVLGAGVVGAMVALGDGGKIRRVCLEGIEGRLCKELERDSGVLGVASAVEATGLFALVLVDFAVSFTSKDSVACDELVPLVVSVLAVEGVGHEDWDIDLSKLRRLSTVCLDQRQCQRARSHNQGRLQTSVESAWVGLLTSFGTGDFSSGTESLSFMNILTSSTARSCAASCAAFCTSSSSCINTLTADLWPALRPPVISPLRSPIDTADSNRLTGDDPVPVFENAAREPVSNDGAVGDVTARRRRPCTEAELLSGSGTCFLPRLRLERPMLLTKGWLSLSCCCWVSIPRLSTLLRHV